MIREEEKNKARWEYVSKRLANPDFPTYNEEYELEAAWDEGAKWADSHPQWISVEDEMPPCNVFVLTCDGQENENLLMLGGDGRWYDKAVGLHRNITHWMALPQPPNVSTESDKEVTRK